MRTDHVAALLLAFGLALAAAAAEDPGSSRLANTVRWTTASEVDNFGYDVYRGDEEDGPFRRLNAQPIPGGGTTDTPQHYEYVDDTIESGRAYYYYVESISMSGARERMTPVFRAPPKGEPAAPGR